jgi:hypothetical protein
MADPRQEVYDYIRLRLGDGMVDVELDPEHYKSALDQAIEVYRQRGANSTEESYAFLEMTPETMEYELPEEIVTVKNIYRRGVGTQSTGSTYFDPFQAAYVNTYLINSGRLGGLLTYELFAQYQELSMRMFGGYIVYHFDSSTRILRIPRKFQATEIVALHVHNYKPDITLLGDIYIKPWLKSYALAEAKMMLGQAREKFGNIAGPQGGTSLNGASLKSEAQAEKESLLTDLKNFQDNSMPLTWVIG